MTNNPENVTWDGDGNIHVPSDGLWTITLDYTSDTMTLTEGQIYGMGPCFNNDWTTGKFPGVVNPDGTATITTLSEGAIAIDGDMSDWAEIEGAETPDAICKIMKVTNDEKFFYVYLASEPGGRGAQLWGYEAGYYYVDFDWDNNEETGIAENSNPGFDCWFYMYVFGGTADAPIIKEHPNGHGEAMSIANVTAKGVITADLIEIELSIPRADMVAVPAGAQARILSWRSKDGTKITQVYTVK